MTTIDKQTLKDILDLSGLTIAEHKAEADYFEGASAYPVAHYVTFRLRDYVSDKRAFYKWVNQHGGVVMGFDDFCIVELDEESYLFPIVRWLVQ